jgi:hypothetical protein
VKILIIEVRGEKEIKYFWVGGVNKNVDNKVKISVYVYIIDVMLRKEKKRSGKINMG